jgi:hypothetical protein
MKNFDRHWQTVATRARQAPGRDAAPPFGFAARVVSLAGSAPAPGADLLWLRLALRSLTGAIAVLIICAALELPHLRNARPLDPGLENTVAQLVWSL